MATQIGSGTGVLATYLANLADTSNIETALKQLYYGTAGGTLSTSTGIYGALYTLFTGNPTLAGSVTITGDLTVNGTTTTINVANLLVEDQEIVIGNVASPSNTTANGGGIRLEAGAGVDKTITWDSSNANWTTSENWNLATGKTLKISNSAVISGTGTSLVIGENASAMTVGISGTLPTGAQTINLFTGTSTTGTTQTINFATGNFGTATQIINIGTGTSSSGTRTINVGSSDGASTTNIKGTVINSGAIYDFQPSPTTGLTTSQTLTIAQLETLIITTAQTIGTITLTLPTGTSIEGGMPASSPNGTSFEFSIINAGSTGSVLISANGNTLVGLMTVALSTTGRFRVVKNATNAYTIYRIG